MVNPWRPRHEFNETPDISFLMKRPLVVEAFMTMKMLEDSEEPECRGIEYCDSQHSFWVGCVLTQRPRFNEEFAENKSGSADAGEDLVAVL